MVSGAQSVMKTSSIEIYNLLKKKSKACIAKHINLIVNAKTNYISYYECSIFHELRNCVNGKFKISNEIFRFHLNDILMILNIFPIPDFSKILLEFSEEL